MPAGHQQLSPIRREPARQDGDSPQAVFPPEVLSPVDF
jgi:hypothetical protein